MRGYGGGDGHSDAFVEEGVGIGSEKVEVEGRGEDQKGGHVMMEVGSLVSGITGQK